MLSVRRFWDEIAGFLLVASEQRDLVASAVCTSNRSPLQVGSSSSIVLP